MKTAVATFLATIPFTGGWAAYQLHLYGAVVSTQYHSRTEHRVFAYNNVANNYGGCMHGRRGT